jgi:hypothetical protein
MTLAKSGVEHLINNLNPQTTEPWSVALVSPSLRSHHIFLFSEAIPN